MSIEGAAMWSQEIVSRDPQLQGAVRHLKNSADSENVVKELALA